MPIYEYACEACGKHFDILQSMNDEPLRICTQCGKEALRKCISAPALQFKGEGWYVTDYKTKPTKNKTEATPAAPATSETSSAKTTTDSGKVKEG